MSDGAQTRVCAYPMPAPEQLDPQLRKRILDLHGEVFDLDGVGLVLAIDADEATDGIHCYDEIIAELHACGLNVFAENLDNPHGIRARREFWRAGSGVHRWLIDPVTFVPLVAIADRQAAINASAAGEELLAVVAEIPTGLHDVAAGTPCAYFDPPAKRASRQTDRVANMIRAYPVPPPRQRTAELHALIEHSSGEILELADVGGVLVIDWFDDGAGIDFYRPLICALQMAGLHVFAQNLSGGRAPAQREFWHPDSWYNNWPIDPGSGEQMIAIGAVEEAFADASDREEILSTLRMPTPPAGLFELQPTS